MVNTLGRCFWSQVNCDLISTSNLGFLFDVTNSISEAIKILILCLQNNTVISFSSFVHMCSKITEAKKMELSTIHEILPPETVEIRVLANNFLSYCNKSCNNWDLLNYCNNFTYNNEFQIIAIKSLRNNFAITLQYFLGDILRHQSCNYHFMNSRNCQN